MVVDTFAMVGDSLFGSSATPRELLDVMAEAKIDRALVCPARPPGYELAPANEALAAVVQENAERLIGFARVDPNLSDAAA